jgi:hypothetical protein
LDDRYAPQIHRGGLSSREGLVALMHDGYARVRPPPPARGDRPIPT